MIATRNEAEAILDPYISIFRGCITSAWREYCLFQANAPHPLTPRSRANIVFDFMKGNAQEKFVGVDGAKLREIGELFFVEIQGRVSVRFKKFNERKMPSNILTQQTLDYMGQAELPFMPSRPTYLIVGYELNRFGTEIMRISVTCPLGNRNEWFFNVEDDGLGVAAFIEEPSPTPLTDDLPIRPIVPREGERKIADADSA